MGPGYSRGKLEGNRRRVESAQGTSVAVGNLQKPAQWCDHGRESWPATILFRCRCDGISEMLQPSFGNAGDALALAAEPADRDAVAVRHSCGRRHGCRRVSCI